MVDRLALGDRIKAIDPLGAIEPPSPGEAFADRLCRLMGLILIGFAMGGFLFLPLGFRHGYWMGKAIEVCTQ